MTRSPLFQPGGSGLLLRLGVVLPIDLNHQPVFVAAEIDDKTEDRVVAVRFTGGLNIGPAAENTLAAEEVQRVLGLKLGQLPARQPCSRSPWDSANRSPLACVRKLHRYRGCPWP